MGMGKVEDLPILQYRSEIIKNYDKHQVLLIVGETGSGKTTQVPKFIYEHLEKNGKSGPNDVIAITQPRRVAAMSLAKRVAEETGTSLGKLVGYNVRFDEVTGPSTRIKFLTDGMLLREALSDPNLSRYSTIILDEAHERTLRTDILFGMIKKLVQNRKRPLKLIIMSATMKAEKFQEFFNDSHLYRVPGRQFPVKLFYTADPQQDYLDAAVISIFQLHIEKEVGDILVFLTGQEEIESVQTILEEHSTACPDGTLKMKICPIYASLPSHQQLAVFSSAPTGSRKIILATNIAETSITIPGVKYVIDPGFQKIRLFTPRTAMEALVVRPISKASARQRCGRAGREQPGECYRLFTEDSFKSLEEETPPEILRSNLSNVILVMKASGIDDVVNFDYIDPPSLDSLKRGLEELLYLGALDKDGSLTEMGQMMAECPLIPSLARVLIESCKLGCSEEVITIVSLLSTESIFHSSGSENDRAQSSTSKKSFAHRLGDHLTLLSLYKSYIANKCSARWCTENFINSKSLKTATDVRNQLVQFCERKKLPIISSIEEGNILKAFCAGYFMQCAYRQPDGSFKTIIGRQTVYIHPSSVLHSQKPDCLIYHELTMTTKCYLRNVTSVEAIWISEYSKTARFQ